MFLDFDLSFESNENSWGILPEYSFIRINTNQAPYWEGYTDDIKPFQFWLDKLIELSLQKFLSQVESLPTCWGVPDNYFTNTFNFIFNNRNHFVEEFKRGIDFHRESNSLNST